jgi:DNA helicase-2/ATP-dependent DNA helicase PcrA
MTSKQRSPLNKIVRTRKKFVEVSASPGSGKTHALIQRVLYLVSIGVPPEEILVLSFSNVSVRVICRRLDLSLDLYSESTSVPVPISIPIPKSKFSSRPTSVTQSKHRSLSTSVDPALLKAVTVKTAHGFANSLLDNKTVMNEKTANEFVSSAINLAIKDCCKGLSSSSKNKAKFKTIHDLLKSKLKTVLSFFSVVSASKKKVSEVLKMSRFLELQSFGKVLCLVHKKFKAIKVNHGQIDYGDMLSMAIDVIDKEPGKVPFTHILVDEYQDCSAAQVYLLAKLALSKCPDLNSKLKDKSGVASNNGRSIMVFGDPNQAIFGFAGASYTPLSSVLGGVIQFSLPLSRRLTFETAALASAVVNSNSNGHQPGGGLHVPIQTNHNGKKPVLVFNKSITEQTQQIVSDIMKLINSGIEPKKIVVLARVNLLVKPVEQLLLAKNISTNRIGIKRNRKHVLCILKLIKIAEYCEKQAAPKSTFHEMLIKFVSSVINIPISDKMLKKPSLELAKICRSKSLEGRYQMCSKIYLKLMKKNLDNQLLSDDFRAMEKKFLIADVNRWKSSFRGVSNVKSMLSKIRLMQHQTDAVLTGTIHSAKGGEWDHVFIVGVTDGFLPLHYSLANTESLNEELNLLYVAITRAKETVHMYHSPREHVKSHKNFNNLSQFLDKPEVLDKLTTFS